MAKQDAVNDQEAAQTNSALENDILQKLEKSFESIVLKAIAGLREFAPSHAHNRLAFSEPEAATLLGVRQHVVRDARLRGEIESTHVGGRIAYTRHDLLKYLENQKG
jgi:hypothetical protein